MIPDGFVQAWALQAPWPDPRQVEQDLIICRALHDLFSHPALQGQLAFRGGTAIHKLLMPEPLRYSEDIDLVYLQPGPIKPLLQAIGDALQWLNLDREVKQSGQSVKLLYRYTPVGAAGNETRKLKVEINTLEHQACLTLAQYPIAINNPWFCGRQFYSLMQLRSWLQPSSELFFNAVKTATFLTWGSVLIDSLLTTESFSPVSSIIWETQPHRSRVPTSKRFCSRSWPRTLSMTSAHYFPHKRIMGKTKLCKPSKHSGYSSL